MSKVDEAIRPKEDKERNGVWIQGVDEEGMDIEVDDAEESAEEERKVKKMLIHCFRVRKRWKSINSPTCLSGACALIACGVVLWRCTFTAAKD